MVKQRINPVLLGLLAAAAVGYFALRGTPRPAAPGPAGRSAAGPPRTAGARDPRRGPELAAIDLARLESLGSDVKAGKRDIFDFAPPPTVPAPPPPPPPPPTLAGPPPGPPVEALATGPPPPPPLNVKFIGAMEDKRRGLKVAILLTDRQEILTGRPGDVVGNRLKIVNIGLESVDVQDVGHSNVRRLPLKGN